MVTLSRLLTALAILLSLSYVAIDACAQSQSQSTTADLVGSVKDETGAVIVGAAVSLIDPQRNFSRTTSSDDEGSFRILAVPPGTYQLIIEASGFARLVNEEIVLELGQTARFDFQMKVAGSDNDVVNVTTVTAKVETSKTAVTQTIDQRRIDNLPINGRNFLNFALTNSQLSRDNAPLVLGALPTTGLTFNGQSSRVNLVQIDGADNIDSTASGVRATISQEAVQEFQVIINSFAPEFGRTAGGVVNIITKSGTNEFHGNLFGFIRHRSIQARNALAFTPNGEKPGFTRGQYGFTFGGPIIANRTFFFISLDQTRRQESGFSQIGLDPTIFQPTPAQQEFIRTSPAGGLYGMLVNSGIQVARTGIEPTTGQRVFLPTFLLSGGQLGAIPPIFRVLGAVENVFPINDKFTFYAARFDHQLTDNDQLVVRLNFTPMTTNGVQPSVQNQLLGLNDRSRTGTNQFRDSAVVVQNTHTFAPTILNDFLFNFARRSAAFATSSDVGIDISGVGFFGSDIGSPVTRVEKRYEFKDKLTIAVGSHTTEFGADINYIRIDPASLQITFAGQFAFGELPFAGFSPLFVDAPPITAVQAYGLGLPLTFVQGFGDSHTGSSSTSLGFFFQDSWQARPNLTFNYGARYDTDLTPTFKPRGISTDRLSLSAAQIDAAERALNIQQGLPRDYNNVAPRAGIAFDPLSDGRTVIRVAGGIFYDRMPLGQGIISDVTDGVQAPLLITTAGNPLPASALNAAQILQGTVRPGVTPGIDKGAVYLPLQSRFDTAARFPGYGLLLPIIVPNSRDLVTAYSTQANLSIERQIVKTLFINVAYLFTGGRKLLQLIDVNSPNAERILQLAPDGTPNDSVFANNFFRPSGPNPALMATALPIPFGSAFTQTSASSSVYHAFSLNLNKRFSGNYQALISYTFSKSIDTFTDFPQNNRDTGADRGLSTFDQRHRFVASGFFRSPYKTRDSRGWKRIMADFTLAPIVEISSGRPYNIVTNLDRNLDLITTNDRPDFDPATGTLSLPAVGRNGTLGHNAGVTPGFVSFDLRVSRSLPITEGIRVELVTEAFNLFNRVNVSSVNSNFRFVRFQDGSFGSSATAAFDPRQFQFAIKLNF